MDRLPAHRSKAMKKFIHEMKGTIIIEYLPPYCPELNPVEYVWNYFKYGKLANFCAIDFQSLIRKGRKALRSIKKSNSCFRKFWLKAGLNPSM